MLKHFSWVVPYQKTMILAEFEGFFRGLILANFEAFFIGFILSKSSDFGRFWSILHKLYPYQKAMILADFEAFSVLTFKMQILET